MEKVNNFFLDNDFDKKIIEVRKLEAQKHHKNDMYAKPLQNKMKDRVEIEMKNYCKGKSFYDIGCAEGLFCDLAMSYGATRSKGVDVVEEKIAKAKLQFPNCEFDTVDCLNLQEEKSYDVVLCSEVLQHIQYKIENSKEYIDWYVREFYPKFFSLFNTSYKFYMHTKKSYLWDVAFRLAIFALKRISYKINFEGYDPYAFRTRDIPTMTRMIL